MDTNSFDMLRYGSQQTLCRVFRDRRFHNHNVAHYPGSNPRSNYVD
jgi:uncharacterized protein (UPF0261 family)